MAEQVIIVGSGWTNLVKATSGGELIVTGSVSISGAIIIDGTSPINPLSNNPLFKFEYVLSGTSTGITGSRIGSITQFIGTGSFVNVLTYANNRISTIGSWS